MFIELIGVPGCGKSTYVENYLKENDATNILLNELYSESRIKQNFNKLKLMMYFIKRYPLVYAKLMPYFMKIKFVSVTKKIKMLLYLFSVLGAIQKRKYVSNDVIVDEGMNQVIWGILYNSGDSEKEVMDLHRQLMPYFGDKIIWLEVEKEEIKRRLGDRQGQGGAELKNDILDDESKLEEAYRFIILICDALKNNGMEERIEKV